MVFFSQDGSILIGTEAANVALANPDRAVFDWKIHMGTARILYADDKGKAYTAQNILTLLLKNTKEDVQAKTGEPVSEVTVTVPANYSNSQKQQTIDAAKEAGMKVLLLPHEPTAGALGNQVHKMKKGKALVYDLGGGTFDVSILEIKGNVCEVKATGGIQKLGGRDINQRIARKVIDAFEVEYSYRPDKNEHAIFYQDLDSRVEQLKISLSAQSKSSLVISCNGDVLNMTVTRTQFEEWISDLIDQTIEKTVKTLKEASLEWRDIDVIYPIGGGSMMPIVSEKLKKAGGKNITQNCEAHCAVALGAAVAGRIEYERKNRDYKVGNVTLPPVN